MKRAAVRVDFCIRNGTACLGGAEYHVADTLDVHGLALAVLVQHFTHLKGLLISHFPSCLEGPDWTGENGGGYTPRA
jgi:hypothetical protein